MTCRQCRAPLKQTQAVYCSPACRNLGHRRYPDRDCQTCSTPLTRQQIANRGRFCSHRCAGTGKRQSPHGAPMADAALAILRANRDWFLTVSDLSIWLYGYDGPDELHLVCMTLTRLRGRGCRFETRTPAWLPVHGCTKAYRLVSEPIVLREAA